MASLSTLFAVLILIVGLLIPGYIIARMSRVFGDRQRERADKLFAGGAIIAMILIMALSIYAAGETHRVLNAIAQAQSAA